MKRILLAAILALGAPLMASAQAPFRPPGLAPAARPTVSPYINLLRRGNTPGFNYFGLVRPEFNALSSIQGLRNDVALNRDMISTGQGGTGGELITGNSAMFLNTGGYFLSSSGGQSSAGVARGGMGPQVGGGAGAAAPRGGPRR
jgi:hypothetical protein